ncbi:MAG: RNA polymerase sigma factor [Caulobacteraceae bacterium]|nr:MAG: RNA polymerase sigma factor [Caulobacteraceae bacterium]
MDANLVKAARDGSQAAFARLVERHQGPLRGFLRRAHGWAEADDIAQEALVTAWSSLDRLRDDEGFRPWLFGIAWKKAQSAARSARRSAARDQDWITTQAQQAADGVAPEERLALEAAQVLGIPLGTVKSHVARGRDRLLASLAETAMGERT